MRKSILPVLLQNLIQCLIHTCYHMWHLFGQYQELWSLNPTATIIGFCNLRVPTQAASLKVFFSWRKGLALNNFRVLTVEMLLRCLAASCFPKASIGSQGNRHSIDVSWNWLHPGSNGSLTSNETGDYASSREVQVVTEGKIQKGKLQMKTGPGRMGTEPRA